MPAKVELRAGQTYQTECKSLFRVEAVSEFTVYISETGGKRIINRYMLEEHIRTGEVKLKGESNGGKNPTAKTGMARTTSGQISRRGTTRQTTTKKTKK